MSEFNKDICCYCGEETGFYQGYEIWKSYDGKWGHLWCVEKYDKLHVKKTKDDTNTEIHSEEYRDLIENLKETEEWLLTYDVPVDRLAAIDMFNELKEEILYLIAKCEQLEDEVNTSHLL